MEVTDLAQVIYDRLTTDECLGALLDPVMAVSHGTTGHGALEPANVHMVWGVRRETTTEPGHFVRAIVTYGRFSRRVLRLGPDKSRGEWSFVVGIFARSTVQSNDGASSPGDLWAWDIYERVIALLGTGFPWKAGDWCSIAQGDHAGDIVEMGWDETLQCFRAFLRFTWTVVGRATVTPAVAWPDPGQTSEPPVGPPPPERVHFLMRLFDVGSPGSNNGEFVEDNLADGFAWWMRSQYDGIMANIQYDWLGDPFDAAVNAMVRRLAGEGKLFWRYFHALDYPLSLGTFGGGPTDSRRAMWFNWQRFNMQFRLGTDPYQSRYRAFYGPQLNKVPLFMFYQAYREWPEGTGAREARELLPWHMVDAAGRQEMANAVAHFARHPGYDLTSPNPVPLVNAGAFIDMTWLTWEDWMLWPPFNYDDCSNYPQSVQRYSGHQKYGEEWPGYSWADRTEVRTTGCGGGSDLDWIAYSSSIVDFLIRLRDAMAAYSGTTYNIHNGEHRTRNGYRIAAPLFLENAWNNLIDGNNPAERWNYAKTRFIEDPRNVLDIRVWYEQPNSAVGVPEGIAWWIANGGWLTFNISSHRPADDPPGNPACPGTRDTCNCGSYVKLEQAYADAAAARAAVEGG